MPNSNRLHSVLIVDDEPIVCEGLKTFPWKSFGCQITGEAADGLEGLKQFRQLRPEIVITDIKMPGFNGLELAKKIKETAPETEIILLTGYADFEYAKDAIKTGISDYLLKPFSFADVEHSVQASLKRIEERRLDLEKNQKIDLQLKKMRPLLKEQIYQDLLDGKLSDDIQKIELCEIPAAKYIIFSTLADLDSGAGDLALYSFLYETISGFQNEFYLAKGIDIISCVLCYKPERSDEYCITSAANFCNLLQRAVEEQYAFSISIGISEPAADLFSLKKLRDQSIFALNQRYFFGGDLIIQYADIEQKENTAPTGYALKEKALHKSLILNDKPAIRTHFLSIADSLISLGDHYPDHVKKQLLKVIFSAINYCNTLVKEDIVPYEEIKRLIQCEGMESFLEKCLHILYKLPQSDGGSLHHTVTDKVYQYIEENYQKDLSLDLLSRQLNYSAAYLSRLIKKNCGRNFMDIVVDCRLKHAKEMLAESDYKINQIAKLCGYQDISYFIQLFRKKEGVTPNDYRSLHNIGKNLT